MRVQGELASAQAGTLYLINALRHPEAVGVIEADGGWDTLPGGWPWLYRLGRELGLEAGDPLVAFMAAQLGMESVSELEGLPPLPARQRLLQVLSGVYGELWAPGLIGMPGRLTYTPSHVDAYLPMSHVRVEIRAAGLDVNPGWVPWLGRVVSFHYQDREAWP